MMRLYNIALFDYQGSKYQNSSRAQKNPPDQVSHAPGVTMRGRRKRLSNRALDRGIRRIVTTGILFSLVPKLLFGNPILEAPAPPWKPQGWLGRRAEHYRGSRLYDKPSQKQGFNFRSRKVMKCNRGHIAVFRGLHFEPDEEMELRNICELAWTIVIDTIAPSSADSSNQTPSASRGS